MIDRLLPLLRTQDTHSDKPEKERKRDSGEDQRCTANILFLF
jgi:hypothetical protein